MTDAILPTWHFTERGPERAAEDADHDVPISAIAWLDPAARLLDFDRLVHQAEDRIGPRFVLRVHGDEHAVRSARAQIVLRYQRLFTRRNEASCSARFDRLLACHAALHDRAKPLVRADHDHALDVWQWVLALCPDASEALQIAALFHDVERLTSEPERRVEQHAPDYLAFKQRHAARGAELMLEVLAPLALPAPVRDRAATLVERHEQPERDPELTLLNEADALSFFALNSAGFLAYFGPEHTEKKVAYTLRRMRSQGARETLRTLRLEPSLRAMIERAQA